ncbi:hypothetical protein AIOL_003339 [Candidatus Rhodobacter oscarellae]|uniref:Hedgehog/Intein (Hint) domain-containing protein n=1 Tax=Candidatus Rhodobacter oscarellae TaxID=1675527 RepID=A0A0J9E6S1_9RHOB|nr:Hint domain-containing protein [Candidatus Rhodobacter lobularis]KMW58366.1 hypothetical protein AIOL_003339 [Candidatus Rhodobacter lobularis]
MPLHIVDPASTETEHVTSVDVYFSGTHIGGGIYFSANHNPTPGGSSNAEPQAWLNSAAELHSTTEIDFTLPANSADWGPYLNGSTVLAGFDIGMHVGDTITGGGFYDGPAIPLLVAMDPDDLSGTVTITGYPEQMNALNMQAGVLHQTSGDLLGFGQGFIEQDVNGDDGGYFQIDVGDVVGGMSGGGNFLDFDADGDGTPETYLIGATSRSLTDAFGTTLQSTAFAPHYADMAAAIQSLTGAAARDADDFARMVLLAGQSAGSGLTQVQGAFFHEDIYGSAFADTLLGAGGNDMLAGRDSDDRLEGGDGADTLNGGAGNDTLVGGAGADLFTGDSFGGAVTTDEISDFDGSEDIVDLAGFFTDISDVIAASTENGADLEINLGAGSMLIMRNTSQAQLSATNTNTLCYAEGTMIATPAGEVAVEALQIGDMVRTDGRAVPVKWIGRQTISKRFAGERAQLVRISAGALGNHSDLYVTGDHGMMLGGFVVNASALVNACSIDWVSLAQTPEVQTVYHIETEAHDVILANGAASETYLDMPGRRAFDNYQEYLDLYGGEATIQENPMPRISSARLLPGYLRERLTA